MRRRRERLAKEGATGVPPNQFPAVPFSVKGEEEEEEEEETTPSSSSSRSI
jgi:hypothetical protein